MEEFHYPAPVPHGEIGAVVEGVLVGPSAPWDWESLRACARLVGATDGGPIRTILTGTKKLVTGSYPSRKAGRAMPYEGMNEHDFIMHCEVDTEVVDYRVQPFRFEFVVDGKKRIYIADVVRLLSSGQIEVVEVKQDRLALKDPDYSLKLECVKEICRRVGWLFRVVFSLELRRPAVRFTNIQDIQAWRTTRYGPGDVYQVCDLLSGHAHKTMGALAEALGDPIVGVAKLKAMMVGRVVRLELNRKLGADTLVSLVTASRTLEEVQ
ncbi:MAG: hypothetical protein K0M78_07605 [Brevundimonas sp.]|nr:hypothetical protein [Brevundimonas sp.]